MTESVLHPAPAPAASPAPGAIDTHKIFLQTVKESRKANPAAAAQMLDGFLAVYPGNAHALVLRGEMHQKDSQASPAKKSEAMGKAIDCFRKAIGADPSCPLANSHLGRCLFETGQTAEAETYLRRALEIQPDNYIVTKNLGFCLVKGGQYEEGISHLRAALGEDPDNPRILNGIGYALCALGDVAAAKAGGSNALNAEFIGAVGEAAALYGESEALLQRAVELSPDSATYRLNLGWCLAGQGEFGLAVDELNKSRKLDPAEARTPYFLALVYKAQAERMAAEGRLDWDGAPGARQVIVEAIIASGGAWQAAHMCRPQNDDIAHKASHLQMVELKAMEEKLLARIGAEKQQAAAPAPVTA